LILCRKLIKQVELKFSSFQADGGLIGLNGALGEVLIDT